MTENALVVATHETYYGGVDDVGRDGLGRGSSAKHALNVSKNSETPQRLVVAPHKWMLPLKLKRT